ncbi:hypothetical protein BLOT_001735 [Blomia tropicalis]|nr:hypothetical protein BLOT_001735 [Blomia tropicalis]
MSSKAGNMFKIDFNLDGSRRMAILGSNEMVCLRANILVGSYDTRNVLYEQSSRFCTMYNFDLDAHEFDDMDQDHGNS